MKIGSRCKDGQKVNISKRLARGRREWPLVELQSNRRLSSLSFELPIPRTESPSDQGRTVTPPSVRLQPLGKKYFTCTFSTAFQAQHTKHKTSHPRGSYFWLKMMKNSNSAHLQITSWNLLILLFISWSWCPLSSCILFLMCEEKIIHHSFWRVLES